MRLVDTYVCIVLTSCMWLKLLVRQRAAHIHHGCAQTAAQCGAAYLEKPQKKAEKPTQHRLATLPNIPLDLAHFQQGRDIHLHSPMPKIMRAGLKHGRTHTHVSRQGDNRHEYLVKVRSRRLPLSKHTSRKGSVVFTDIEFLKRTFPPFAI